MHECTSVKGSRLFAGERAIVPLEDDVSVSDNPAYQIITIQKRDEQQLRETANITDQSTAARTPVYENIAAAEIHDIDLAESVPEDHSEEYDYI